MSHPATRPNPRPGPARPRSGPTGSPAPLPLYLAGRRRTRVAADAGTLTVRTAGSALKRYPLVRVSRVVCGPAVEFSASARTALLAARIPVVYLDGRGFPVGYLQPAQTRPSSLDRLLRELLSRPGWRERHANWRRAARMRLLRDWASRRRAAGSPVSSEEFGRLVHVHVYRGEWADPAGGHVYLGAVSAFVVDALQKAGLSVSYCGHDGTALDLATELVDLLRLALALEMRGLGEAVDGDAPALLRVLHAFGGRLNRLCAQLLGQLHRHAREELAEWR